MKKLVTAFAACALAGLVNAQVKSVNIVGYENTTLKSGEFNMVAGSFLGIGADGWKLNEDFSGTNLIGADNSGSADQILIWDAQTGGYTTYFLFDYGLGGEWVNGDTYDSFETDYPNGAPAGTALWLLTQPRDASDPAPTVTFSGEVPSAASYTFNLKKGEFNMIGNPYPVALKLNDPQQVQIDGAVGADNSGSADQILIWDAQTGGYTTYFLFDYGLGGEWVNGDTYDSFETDYPDGLAQFSAWYLAFAGTGTVDFTFLKNF